MTDMLTTGVRQVQHPNITRMVVVTHGPAPMSVPCLFDRQRDLFLVGDGVPADRFEEKVGKCKSIDAACMRSLASATQPAIGYPSRVDYIVRTTADIRRMNDYRGVHPDRVDEAVRQVPIQNESWTCGVNSGARFAAMLRQTLKNYWPYVHGTPRYGGFLGIPDIGPNPEGLQNHLRNQSELSGTDIHQVCHVRFHGLWESFIDSVINKKRPALVLFMNSGASLHWVCLVGKNCDTDNWIYLDTHNFLWEIPGGDDDLKHRMNVGNTAPQKFGFVERFNCIVSTGNCHEKD